MAVTFLVLDSVTVRVGLVIGMSLDLCRVRDSRGRVVTALLARAPATRACCCGEEVDITVGWFSELQCVRVRR